MSNNLIQIPCLLSLSAVNFPVKMLDKFKNSFWFLQIGGWLVYLVVIYITFLSVAAEGNFLRLLYIKGFRPLEFDDRIFLEIGERSVFLKVCDISHINAAGDYSEIFTVDKRKFLIEKPLREWEARLPEKYFLRIHRQTIINLEEVEEIEAWFNRTFQARLKKFPQSLAVSRRYAVKLKSKFT